MGFSVSVCLCVSVCVCGCVGVLAAASMMVATPERIELEICRRSSEVELQEEPEEVSEEVLNLFNLNTDNKAGSKRSAKPQEASKIETISVLAC